MSGGAETDGGVRARGLAAWAVGHPIGVTMIALAVAVLGVFSLRGLGVDLLPHIIYPSVHVLVTEEGVPATIMEDQVTRLLEEELATTEDAVSIATNTWDGGSRLYLSFPYGKDIDQALRDASSRLDRAKRYLPESADAPAIWKQDPSQTPVAELAISSTRWDPVELRAWVDYVLSKWFVNLPGVASTAVGGGLVREILVLPDPQRLAGLGLDIFDLLEALRQDNVDTPGGLLLMDRHQVGGHTEGRFRTLAQIEALPISLSGGEDGIEAVRLSEIARILDSHQEEQLRIRVNEVPAVKLTIEKQAQANTVAVADTVRAQLRWLKDQRLIPPSVRIVQVTDPAVLVRRALRNALSAALTGGVLAMFVVYLFLGDIRRTLIIGSVIPIAMLVTFAIMALGGLTLNVMTLGGLALGVGLLVDNTIVMLENIVRHQRQTNDEGSAAVQAANEVNSALVASTTTNLAAVAPFFFIGGLIGLIFRELIFTISAAIVASLIVALTLVPALAGRVPATAPSRFRSLVERATETLQNGYTRVLAQLMAMRWAVILSFVTALALALPALLARPQTFLPPVDTGQVTIRIVADPTITLDEMDKAVARVEKTIRSQPEVATWFTSVGGGVFGRSENIATNRASMLVQLVPARQRQRTTGEWIERMRETLATQPQAGVRVRVRNDDLPGIRLGRGEDRVSLRVQGDDLDTLARLGERIKAQLSDVPELRNVFHTAEEEREEFAVKVDRERAGAYGLTTEQIGRALRVALGGIVATDFIDEDHSVDVRLRLPHNAITAPDDIEDIVLFAEDGTSPIHLGEVASIELIPSPRWIVRDQQRRIVEIRASLTEGADMEQAWRSIEDRLATVELPEGYALYDAGAYRELQRGRELGQALLALALFLVLVVMAVQYESLRNPLAIMASVPFTLIGVTIGIHLADLPLSMPVWLGLIMLAGIVVNNSIVLIEYTEIERRRGKGIREALLEAARRRVRPILMTTLTTVIGMLPLAMGFGEGTELLEPLAVTIVAGLSFSTMVSLVLVPMVYELFACIGRRQQPSTPAPVMLPQDRSGPSP